MIRNVTLFEKSFVLYLLLCSIRFTNGQEYILTSDWDDTLASSGTGFVGGMAGKDKSIAHGIVYPAVQDLYKSIAPVVNIVSNNFANPENQKTSKETRLNKWWKIYHPQDGKALQIKQVYNGVFLHSVKICDAYCLYLCSLRKNCDPSEKTFKDIGERKFQHLKVIKENAPSSKIIFFGDNGQGDVAAAQHALKEKIINIGMIHISTETPTVEIKTKSTGLYVFMNYVQAAYIMNKIGVLREEQYDKIEQQNKTDLKTLMTLKDVGYLGVKTYLEGINCKVTKYAEKMVPNLEARFLNKNVIWKDEQENVVRGCPNINSLYDELTNEQRQNITANNLHKKIKMSPAKIIGGITGGLLIAAAAKYTASKAPKAGAKNKTKPVKKENRSLLNQNRTDNRGTKNDTIIKVSDEIEKLNEIPANINSTDLVVKDSIEEKLPKENPVHDNACTEKKQTDANVSNDDTKNQAKKDESSVQTPFALSALILLLLVN